jgi:hypothetical protein
LIVGNQHAVIRRTSTCSRKEIIVGGSSFTHMSHGPTDRPIRLRTRI